MRRALFMLLTAFMLLLPIASWSGDVPLIWDNMDAYSLGTTFTSTAVYSNSTVPTWGAQYYGEGAHTATISPEPANPSNKVLDLYDTNTDNTNLVAFHYFKQFQAYTGGLSFDVMLPQNTTGFTTRIGYSNAAQMPDVPKSWAAGIAFGGNQGPDASGSHPGSISYQTKSVPNVWEMTSATYTPNTWYTVVVSLDWNSKKFTVNFGPKGTPVNELPEITPAGGVPFIVKQDQPAYVVPVLNCMSFATSTSTGGDPAETEGHVYIDNVYFHGFSENDGEWIQNIDDILKLPTGRYLETTHIQGRCAMVGTDQLGKPFFYLTGIGANGKVSPRGIRVRQDPMSITVHQGDFVDVLGYTQRANDSAGISPARSGELEIYAISLNATAQSSALPSPRTMKNRDIGGGNQTNMNEASNLPTYTGVFAQWIDPAAKPPSYLKAPGPCNIGTYGRFYGKVTYVSQDSSDPYWPYIYIDDGSGVFDGSLPDGTNQQKGVRVLLRKDRTDMVDFTKLLGKNIIVPGIIGADGTNDLNPSQKIVANVRLIRAIEEPFYDDNGNGYYDGVLSNDWNYDPNLNGIYDGILVLN